jgi:hypothetical protein
MNPHTASRREARFLAHIARPRPRDTDIETAREIAAAGLDTNRLMTLVDQNRLTPLLYRNLKTTGLHTALPAEAVRSLRQRLRQELLRGALLAEATRDLLERFHREGARVILLRGLAVGESVYADGSLRPYSDLDLLLLKKDLPTAKTLLHAAGYGPPATSMEDGYYERQHLHLLYVQEKTGVMAEVHWALDHRFTPWLIDYEDVFRGTRPGTVAGAPALVLSEEDMLLSLCIHLVKHCPCVELLLELPDADERILAAGWWIHVLDVAEAVARYREVLDWNHLADKARRWNIEPAVRAGLLVAEKLLQVSPPANLITSLACPPRGRISHRLQAWQLRCLAPESDKPAHRTFGFRRDIAFRPIRLVDAWDYLCPDSRYLARRYPNLPGILRRPRHVTGAIGSLAFGLADLLCSQWRHRRKKVTG